MESQKIMTSQGDLEKEGQNWRHHTSSFQTLLQSYKIKNMVLALKTDRPMEHNIEPRNKPMQICSVYL